MNIRVSGKAESSINLESVENVRVINGHIIDHVPLWLNYDVVSTHWYSLGMPVIWLTPLPYSCFQLNAINNLNDWAFIVLAALAFEEKVIS